MKKKRSHNCNDFPRSFYSLNYNLNNTTGYYQWGSITPGHSKAAEERVNAEKQS